MREINRGLGGRNQGVREGSGVREREIKGSIREENI